ncbi:MAG: bacterial Ig-like domain-containing protein [Bacteroidales bacterium]|nr:bacterial Ig-like domain-containing protein [Bacteroidales bacterium]
MKSLAITGEPTNKEYFVGDAFSTDGLKVNATYDDATQEDVTTKATWAFTPATFTEAGAVSVTATASYGGVSASTSCPVTVKTIANTKETAYTVAEAIKLIDNGKTDVRVYVKGIVSKIVTPYSTQYKNITFNVSDDGATTTPQFQFFRNQKDAEHTYAEDPKIEVGATVIGYGILKKYNKTYEFDEGNYLVEYKAPFVPTYTYTWMVNGAEVKKSVLKAGAAVEAPANPENIDGKVFTGWVTTATVDANKKPEYATIDATAKANTTYYAVFATLKQGAGEKWVKKTASEITVEGVYALITKDGKAFNGTIIDASGSAVVKGNGESTTDAFIFDSNNEATSAPEGTCELTFVKSGEGFKMLNADKTQCLYSYQNAKESLSWKAAEKENSYWLFYDDNWAYKQSATTYTYLRVYNSTFRTYTGNNSNEDMYFAQKVAGAGYADFTTIVKAAEVTTLANLAVKGTEGKEYTVNDEMVVAKKFQKGDKNYIVVKDAAQAVKNVSAPAPADKFFNINGNKQEEYAQNNWMLVSLPVKLYNQLNEKSTVTSITGTLTEKTNVAMEATNVVFENATNDFAPNTYCPINFMGESSVKGTNPAYTSSYYFATPKANEYANVVWAVYNGTDGAFYLPSHTTGSINVQEFKAAFNVDYSLNSVDNPTLTDGEVYSFEALVKEVAVATTDAKSAPRKTAYVSTVAPSTKFVVYPLDLDDKKVATGVNDVNSAKEVKGVSYFNMMGVESAQPFDGVNIMVTTYTDGTQSATKVLR